MTPKERAASNGPLGTDSWPKITERFVVPAIEAEIRDRQATAQQFLGTKGDVLIWHGRLLHRGTKPKRLDIERRALIAHYSGVSHRPDMPHRATDKKGGVYASFDTPLF
jgi:ectoine hydroxylase-related dioxygenase (phytanoyl-CoA dioxygenase family)